jgi:predicted enzyme related to lactoylglutathione lyase
MSELEPRWCQDGVPCWVDTLQPDPDSAVGFYAELFGWEVENRTASDSPQKYFVCMLRGRDVAGVGSRPEGSKRFYGAVFGWDTLTFDAGGRELTMWGLPGYVGGVPGQPVPPDVVAAMASITGEGFPVVGQAGLQPLLARAVEDIAPHWSVNFWVPDADAVVAKAAELGGRVVVPPYDAPGFRATVVADPRGAALTVGQPTADA